MMGLMRLYNHRKANMECIYCNQPVPENRWEAGYHYCFGKDCQVQAIQERRANYRLVLMPKQGFGIVDKDSPDLMNGRSSGRQ